MYDINELNALDLLGKLLFLVQLELVIVLLSYGVYRSAIYVVINFSRLKEVGNE